MTAALSVMVPNIRQLQAPSHIIYYWEQATYRHISQCGMFMHVLKLLEYNHPVKASCNLLWSHSSDQYVYYILHMYVERLGYRFRRTPSFFKSLCVEVDVVMSLRQIAGIRVEG